MFLTPGGFLLFHCERTESEHPFIGPELACGISIGVAKKAVRDWTNRNYKE
jgi:hypothetical protein